MAAFGVLVLTAGCAEIYDVEETTAGPAGTDAAAPAGGGAEVRPDPESDLRGWEHGVWYDENLSITPEDGLDDAELRLAVNRAMARVERLRGLEFERNVSIEVISREQYRQRNPFDYEDDPFENQVYEALFLVDEDTSAASALERLYGGSVAGYYYDDRIVIVSDDGAEPVALDRATLAHELTHALQDQHFDTRLGAASTDERAAVQSLPEGEANYVEDRYVERCGAGWQCLPPVESASSADYNRGLFLTLFLPYSDGPTLVADLIDRADGEWTRVNDVWAAPPESTEQVIHPEAYPDERPVPVQVEDRSARAWAPVESRGRSADVLGEAGVFAMLWANGVVPEQSLFDDPNRYNYSHPASAGWGGDRIRVYERDGDYAYVWRSVWDSERDAREFVAAYRELLASKGAVDLRGDRYRIPAGDFADAFRVTRTGRAVTIVNAPTVTALADVHSPPGPRATAAPSTGTAAAVDAP